jgi:hypothetical protein
MKKKHLATLELIFSRPTPAGVKWREAVSMMKHLGAEVEERAGSRVAFYLKGAILLQHKPHPSPDMDKGAVASMKDFLDNLGIRP